MFHSPQKQTIELYDVETLMTQTTGMIRDILEVLVDSETRAPLSIHQAELQLEAARHLVDALAYRLGMAQLNSRMRSMSVVEKLDNVMTGLRDFALEHESNVQVSTDSFNESVREEAILNNAVGDCLYDDEPQ
jgi:hypothetical protein